MLRNILQDAYKPFFDDPGPKNATVGALEEYLRSTGAKGGVIDKCVTFFLSAAREADIPLSPQLVRGLGRGAGRSRSTMRKRTPKQLAPAASAGGMDTQLVHALVNKFPNFDPNWSDDLRRKWFEAFLELLKMIK